MLTDALPGPATILSSTGITGSSVICGLSESIGDKLHVPEGKEVRLAGREQETTGRVSRVAFQATATAAKRPEPKALGHRFGFAISMLALVRPHGVHLGPSREIPRHPPGR